MRLSSLAALFCACLSLAACDTPAEFAQPLVSAEPAAVDERLVGSWLAASTRQDPISLMLVVRPDGEGKLVGGLSATAIEPGPEGGTAFYWFKRTATPVSVDGKTYYNTTPVGPGGGGYEMLEGEAPSFADDAIFAQTPERGVWIIEAEIDASDRLTLRFLADSSTLREKVAHREIACGGDCSFTLLEPTPEQLVDLIRTTPREDLFSGSIGPFARLGEVYPAD